MRRAKRCHRRTAANPQLADGLAPPERSCSGPQRTRELAPEVGHGQVGAHERVQKHSLGTVDDADLRTGVLKLHSVAPDFDSGRSGSRRSWTRGWCLRRRLAKEKVDRSRLARCYWLAPVPDGHHLAVH